jgi:uncharacterized membrane protein YtjA (UPF0391 family)
MVRAMHDLQSNERRNRGVAAAGARPTQTEELAVFTWSLIFFVIAIIAAIFGFGGVAAGAAGAAKLIFVIALILAVVGFFMGRRSPRV